MTSIERSQSAKNQDVARKPFSVAVAARLDGPGGYYNIGNVLGLAVGLGIQISLSVDGAAKAIIDYLVGNPAALCISIATLIFTISGEAYHRAWAQGAPPIARLNTIGDVLSGAGALWLGLALLLLGQPFLAATAGLMHAFGKFGSAMLDPAVKHAERRGMLFRKIVLYSRVPALVAMSVELVQSLQQGHVAQMFMSGTLIACYLLWAKADILLMKP